MVPQRPDIIKNVLCEHLQGSPKWGARVECIVMLLSMVLKAQVICYRYLSTGVRRYFLQTKGIATGLLCGAQIANVFLRGLDLVLSKSLSRDIYFYTRYIDDIFVIARPGVEGSILELLNDWHEDMTITVGYDPSKRFVSFLDLSLSLEFCNGSWFLNWETYFKPLNTYMYVPWLSLHPLRVKLGIVKSQVHRLMYTNRSFLSFQKHWEFLKGKFQRNGYPVSALDECCNAMCNKSKSDRIESGTKADFIVPIKMKYFRGAERVPLLRSAMSALPLLGVAEVQEEQVGFGCFQHGGKLFRLVSCMLANQNQFVKRHAKFL